MMKGRFIALVSLSIVIIIIISMPQFVRGMGSGGTNNIVWPLSRRPRAATNPNEKVYHKILTEVYTTPSREKPWQQVLGPAAASLSMAMYGSALCAYAADCPGQVRCLTMFRATGYKKFVAAMETWRVNFQHAKLAAIWRAPSFVMARRSVLALDKRIALHRKAVAKVREAKADGVITPQEAKEIARLEKQKMRLLKNDMKRIVRAAASLKDVFQALDFGELRDITKGFMFQLLAVLSAGDEQQTNGLGRLVGRWCLFLNLGSLVLDTAKALRFPIAHFWVKRKQWQKIAGIKLTPAKYENTERIILYAASAYLVSYKRTRAQRLNSALLASSIVMQGSRKFVQEICDWDDDDDDGIWPAVASGLDSIFGGFLRVLLAVQSYRNQGKVNHDTKGGDTGSAGRPSIENAPWMVKTPLLAIETGVDFVAEKVNKII